MSQWWHFLRTTCKLESGPVCAKTVLLDRHVAANEYLLHVVVVCYHGEMPLGQCCRQYGSRPTGRNTIPQHCAARHRHVAAVEYCLREVVACCHGEMGSLSAVAGSIAIGQNST